MVNEQLEVMEMMLIQAMATPTDDMDTEAMQCLIGVMQTLWHKEGNAHMLLSERIAAIPDAGLRTRAMKTCLDINTALYLPLPEEGQ